jgi:hypothetical protein
MLALPSGGAEICNLRFVFGYLHYVMSRRDEKCRLQTESAGCRRKLQTADEKLPDSNPL